MLRPFLLKPFLGRNSLVLVKARVEWGQGSRALSSGDSAKPELEQERKEIKRVFKKGRGTGDKGQSSLFTGERRWKDDAVFEALGACDELTSLLGIVREQLDLHGLFELVERITAIQCDIQDIAAHLATPRNSGQTKRLERTEFDQSQVDLVDYWIDEYAQSLPELTQFILPGGGILAAHVHHARAVCRRAERRVSTIVRQDQADTTVLRYLNRLSDFLFVLGRYSCYSMNRSEIAYKKTSRRSVQPSDAKWSKTEAK